MATMALIGSWAEYSLAPAPGTAGDTVGAAAGGVVGATAITDAPVMGMVAAATRGVATLDVATRDVVTLGEGTREVDTAVVAHSMALRVADSTVGPRVASTEAAVVVSTAEAAVVSTEAAADTGNTWCFAPDLSEERLAARAASRFLVADVISC